MARHTENTLRWAGKTDYITTGASSVQSAVWGSTTQEIRVVCYGNPCHINIGQNPTAAATDDNGFYLPANTIEYLHVNPGQRLAVIQETGAGTLCVSEMTR